MFKLYKFALVTLVTTIFACISNAQTTLIKDYFLYGLDFNVSGYQGTTELSDFPVLVKLSEETVPNFSYELCKADASDIRFADANGNIIPHEIEVWNPEGESYIWVKLPTLSGTNTSFKMYLGLALPIELPENDPTDVWSAYAAVFHGGEKIFDSTGNSPTVVTNSVNGFNTGDNVVAGAMYKPKNSKGVQFLNPVTTGAMSTNNVVSFSGWFKRSSSGTVIVAANKSTWAASGFLAIVEAGTYFSLAVSSTHQGKKNAGALQNGVWGHLAFSYDDTKINSYFNGENIYSNENGLSQIDQGETYWAIGNYADQAKDGYVGDMDEIRFYNGVASADWIKAEYDSAISVDTFVSYGKVENLFDYKVSSVSYSFVNDNTVSISYEIDKNYESGTSVASVSLLYGRTNDEGLIEKELGTTTGGKYSVTISDLVPGDYTAQIKMSIEKNGNVIDVVFAPISFVINKALEPVASYKSFEVRIQYEGTPAENVPVMIRISEEKIAGFSYADVVDDKLEILDSNKKLLPYEIDTWNEEGESCIWVSVPNFTNNEIITVRYGSNLLNKGLDSKKVWNDYVGVWHLNGLTDASTYGTYPNSTATQGIDGEKAAASTAGEEGVFGKSVRICNADTTTEAQKYGGVFIPDSGNNSPVDLGPKFAFSAWFKHGTQDIYYDHVLYKRLKSNNGDSPNNAYAIEMTGGTTTSSYVDARGSDGTGTKITLPNSVYDWSYITFIYNDTQLLIYQNGELVKTSKIAAVKDNNAPIAIGNNVAGYGDALGDCAWNGWVDEMRLVAGVPSPEYIAAEYAAMANENALVYSHVSDIDPAQPVILAAPTLVWTESGFKFSADVAVGNGDVCAIYKDLATGLAITNTIATLTSDMESPLVVEEYPTLQDGTMYSFSVLVFNSDKSAAKRVDGLNYIYCGDISIEKLADADELSYKRGVFRFSRSEFATVGDLTFDVVLSGDAIDLGVAENVLTTVTIPDGTNYVDIEIAPIYSKEVNEDVTLTVTITGTTVSRAGELFAEMTVVNIDGNPFIRYVSPDGNDENDGLTTETAMLTIGNAVKTLDNLSEVGIASTVYVQPGLYSIATPIYVTNAISIIGTTGNPSDVVVSNTQPADWNHQNQRIFYISNSDAYIENLTMSKGSYHYGSSGGNFYIGKAGGVVSNCVVVGGYAAGNAAAGGAWLDAGKVTHTIFRGNYCTSGSVGWSGVRSGVIHLTNSSIVENCLFEKNNQSTEVVLIRLEGSSILRNCTIVNNSLSKTNEVCTSFSPMIIASGAKAINVVIAGVTNTIDGATCVPVGTVANYINGALDGDITGRGYPENTIVGTPEQFFKDYAAGDYRTRTGGVLADAGQNYDGMAAFDLSGEQDRLIGSRIDIGCYEASLAGTLLIVK